PVPFTASTAREAILHAVDALGELNAVIGHSLGAGLLLDVANERTFQRLVLLSPPPTPVARLDFSHTLVVTGNLDIPAINAFVPRLEGAEWWRLAWSAHSSMLMNPSQTRDIVRWLGGNV